MELSYDLYFHGNIHIGSGVGIPGILDERVIRDQDGFAYIPAVTIKGLVRQSCIDLIRYRGQQERLMCKGQLEWSQADVQQPGAGDYCQNDKQPCLVCLLFGSPVIKGAVWFSPAGYPEEYRDLVRNTPFPAAAAERDMATSAHAAMDRRSGRAKEHQLYNLEVVQPADHFEGTIRVEHFLKAVSRLSGNDEISPEESLGWLTAALLFTRAIGGRRRRGWGQCQFTLAEPGNTAALQAVRQLFGGAK